METLLFILALALIYKRARENGIDPLPAVIPAALGWFGITAGFSFLASIPAFYYLGIVIRWLWLALFLWLVWNPGGAESEAAR